MILFLLSKVVTQTAGYLYPAYLSYKALKARDARTLVHCLQYWAVLGIYSCVELFTDMFLFWFPFYYELKLLFVLWLVLPFTNGATVIYRTLLHPTFEHHEKHIDVALQQIQTSAKQTSTEWGRRGFHAIQKVAVDSIAARLGNGNVETHLSVLSERSEQAGSLLFSAANTPAVPSPRIREILSSDEEGGTSMLSGILPALTLSATSHRVGHVPMANDEARSLPGISREEQYINSQRAQLYTMMDQLNKAEAEVKRNQRQTVPTTAPAPVIRSKMPLISTSDACEPGRSESVEILPTTEPNPTARRRSRRHVLADVDNKLDQPHPPRTTRPPHRQTKGKNERSSNSSTSSSRPLANDSSPSSSFAAGTTSDSDGLVLIDEDLSFTDRELDELVAGISTMKPRPTPNLSRNPDSTNASWFPSLW